MTKDQLKARFPYMFEGPNIGLDFYEGWIPILVDACEKIDAILGPDKAGFHFEQIKEKYGSARLYAGSNAAMGAEMWSKVQAVLDDAETKTETACMRCGAPAQIELHGFWWACLCEVHVQEWSEGRRPRSSP